MAKQLTFVAGKLHVQAGISKVDRDKVYGFIEDVALDRDGNPCSTANLLEDGATIVLSGGTALKTVAGNFEEVDKATLKTVYQDGTDAVLVPSSYDAPIELQPASLEDLFSLEVQALYQLTWDDLTAKNELLQALSGSTVYRFVFNYRADYEGADAVVIRSGDEAFVLTGRMMEFEYLNNVNVLPSIDLEPTEQDDETDFAML
jgi:hypothetical protein